MNVAINGNTYFDTETLRERMFLQPKSLALRYGRYSETFRKKDQEAIENLYQANGFRDVKVTSSVQADYKGKSSDMAATFRFTKAGNGAWRISKYVVLISSIFLR